MRKRRVKPGGDGWKIGDVTVSVVQIDEKTGEVVNVHPSHLAA